MAEFCDTFASQRYPGPSLPTLNHIRLVSLLPGSSNTITCELITADIHSAPEYEALSYTWGDALDRQAIHMQSTALQQSTELLATSNCVSALHRLRYKDRPRMLWVDSLCINQLDISEKNHQISLMSKIYSQATNVVIYLGEFADNSDLVIEFIAECDNPSPETTSLKAFLSNAALAYYGEKTISWSAIKNLRRWNVASEWLQRLPFVISALKKSLMKSNMESSMFTALNQTRHCFATNQRDKVYALLPLFQAFSEQLNITPKYGDTIAKVYTDCAVALLPKCGFKILSAAQGSSSIDHLPSWVPDWSSARKCSYLGISERIFGRRQVNDEDMPELITHDSTNNSENTVSLRIAGHLCGRILNIGSTYIAGQGLLPITEWRRLAFNDSVVSPTIGGVPRPESIECTFYNVLAAYNYGDAGDRLHRFFRGHELYNLYDDYETSWVDRLHKMASLRSDEKVIGENILPFDDIPFHLAATEVSPTYQEYVQSVLKACHSRRFFITDTGYMGIAPDNAQITDHVYICAGAAVPFVFRETGGKPRGLDMNQFRLVGESYIEEKAWEDYERMPNIPGYLEII
ncbi:heterokaryon incompatibility domain-containing protein [Trichoderma chlorosporum]